MLRLLLIIFCIASYSSANAQLIEFDKLDTATMFSSIKEALENPQKVYRLDLSKKKLTKFPTEILQFSNLNELILDKNKIDSIPSSIASLSNLQRLSIYRNKLVNIDFITVLPNLVEIDLTANYIEAIPSDIANLFKLKVLILQLNTITEFPISMREIKILEKFNLLDNDLNREQQHRIRAMFPDIKVEMSAPCNCNYDEE